MGLFLYINFYIYVLVSGYMDQTGGALAGKVEFTINPTRSGVWLKGSILPLEERAVSDVGPAPNAATIVNRQ